MRYLKYLFLLMPIAFFGCGGDDDSDDVQTGPRTFDVTIENVTVPKPFFQSGGFNTPVGASSPASLLPGDAYEFTVNAGPHVLPMDGGTRLSFATMFVQSNDLFFAPDGLGIALYDAQDNAIGRNGPMDVTSQVKLWDAGTEVNETTGGPNQKPQQGPMEEDKGVDENGVVTMVTGTDAALNPIPANNAVIKVTVEYMGDATFKVRILNVSTPTTMVNPGDPSGTSAVPLSPGAYVIHTQDNPLFVAGAPAAGAGVVASQEGIENIAEDGFPMALITDLAAKTGLVVPLSRGAYAVHQSGTAPIYNLGTSDKGEGLEAIAEDGVGATLAASLLSKSGVSTAGAFNTAVGSSTVGAIPPGKMFKFSFNAAPGARLSLATMFVQSNDWFYSFGENGIDLFNGNQPISGDVTSSISLYDAGTEVDQVPGAGLDQVIRQQAPNTGAADANSNVRLVSATGVPATSDIIRVTVTPK